MKNSVIAFLLLFLLGCASTQESRHHISYKLKESGKLIKPSYTKITKQEAKVLFESFNASHHELVKAASNNREIKINLYYSCRGYCKYIVMVFIPCSGTNEYYFEPLNSERKLPLNFIKKQNIFDECCLVPPVPWYRRILNI